jgi:hypothetical protein
MNRSFAARGVLAIGVLIAGGPFLFANSGGPTARLSGAPGEDNCSQCHGGVVSTGPGSITITAVNAATWTPGATIRLRVTLSDPNARRWGFQLTARKSSSTNTAAGVLTSVNTTDARVVGASGNVQHGVHNTAGTRPGTSGSSTWEFDWQAPSSADFGNVTFYASGNAANNDGAADAGDRVYLTSLTLSPASAVQTKSYVLPQFVFGDGGELGIWYTALYLHNPGDAAANATVRFRRDNGSDMPVPLPGGGAASTHNLNLPARGTVIIEGPASGAFEQGYAELDLPETAVAYAVFRQTVPGRPDQEAVVRLADDSKTSATMIFDDTAPLTAIAVLNPKNTNGNLTIRARDAAGAVIATETFALNAKNKQAFLLSGRPAFAAVQGKRGVVEFSIDQGAVAVLGLRFGGSAFTSIPVESR